MIFTVTQHLILVKIINYNNTNCVTMYENYILYEHNNTLTHILLGGEQLKKYILSPYRNYLYVLLTGHCSSY